MHVVHGNHASLYDYDDACSASHAATATAAIPLPEYVAECSVSDTVSSGQLSCVGVPGYCDLVSLIEGGGDARASVISIGSGSSTGKPGVIQRSQEVGPRGSMALLSTRHKDSPEGSVHSSVSSEGSA